jgi:hypothetical protein
MVTTLPNEGIDPLAGHYFLFGGCLRSQLEFPDLTPLPFRADPDWELSVDLTAPPAPIELLGSRMIAPEWVFRYYRVKDGLRLEYGRTGSYDILSGGRRIVWYRESDPEDVSHLLEMARAIVLGPVMAVALDQAGKLCLHGSAVAIGAGAVAFLAPKFHGKSTLALSLTAAGARLITDDLVAIEPGSVPLVLPGVHSVRLMDDIAALLGPWFSGATMHAGFKQTLTNLPERGLAWEPARLTAIYVLTPMSKLEDNRPAARDILPPARAAASLALQKKLTDELTGYSDAGSVLARISSVASTVPVYSLRIVRDLERLPDVVREIMAWHGETVSNSPR